MGCTTSATPTPVDAAGQGRRHAVPHRAGASRGWDFRHKQIRTLVNGEVKQDGNTDEMKWDMHYLVADIARTITLQPGDVLLSGTPAISRTVYPGDVVEVAVEGLGRCVHIVEGPTHPLRRGRSPPRARRCSPRPRAATGSSAASASRTCRTPESRWQT